MRYRRSLMATMREWVAAARPRTLPAAVVPVAIGSAVASGLAPVDAGFVVNATTALAVSLALQIGVNYANDYSDGVRGTDTERRGPMRLVGSGAAEPSVVRLAAFTGFGVAAACGVLLASRTTWWLVPLGVLCIAAGWTYTGGPKPYGYAGFGEAFVFVFFGLVATAGTAFVAGGRVTGTALVAGAAAGFLATALLLVNNIRDIDGDRASGKRTMAVRLGRSTAGRLYEGCFVGAGAMMIVTAIGRPAALIGLVGLLSALPAITTVRAAKTPAELVAALGMTGRAQLVAGLLYAAGLAIR